jgi:hypothetical protein
MAGVGSGAFALLDGGVAAVASLVDRELNKASCSVRGGAWGLADAAPLCDAFGRGELTADGTASSTTSGTTVDGEAR